MKKNPDYLMRYWLDYRLNIDECSDISIKTTFTSKKYPDINYEVSLYNDNELVALIPVRAGRKILKKYPDILQEISSSSEGIQIKFDEKHLKTLAEDLRLEKKDFPPDEVLVERFLKYKERLQLKKKKRKKRRRPRISF